MDNILDFEVDGLSIDDEFEKKVKEQKPITVGNNDDKKKTKKNKIDLFKETPDPIELDPSTIKKANYITFVINDISTKIPDDKLNKIEAIFKHLGKDGKGYGIRIYCNKINSQVFQLVRKYFSYDRTVFVKPWEKYCNVSKFKIFTPSDENIKASVKYVKNFHKLPTGIKYIKAAMLTLLLGPYNNSALKYVLVYDPHYTNPKQNIDFKKSKETSDVYFIINNLKDVHTFDIFNMYKNEDVQDLVTLIK